MRLGADSKRTTFPHPRISCAGREKGLITKRRPLALHEVPFGICLVIKTKAPHFLRRFPLPGSKSRRPALASHPGFSIDDKPPFSFNE
jgi:hypothetical protein